MAQHDLRTYRRRDTTRESGYHTCEETTGGECIVSYSERYASISGHDVFSFYRDKLELTELFENGLSIIAFGGYVFSNQKANITINIEYCYEGKLHSTNNEWNYIAQENCWTNIGAHVEQIINKATYLSDVKATLTIDSDQNNTLDFISFDFDTVQKDEFVDKTCSVSFYQKTNMHVPYLYYLQTTLPFNTFLSSNQVLTRGQRIILKSCNRCGRFLPININNELMTLSFSLHCKKRAPCKHSTFRSYEILNYDDLTSEDLEGLKLEGRKIISYYGHQLECKACKKFFVNAPLNPQRNPQQFKEDGLRRRAIEVLVNTLLDRNLVHFEFEQRTKKEFSKYIWEKFNKRCFKCGADSPELKFEDMALDHTMPLAYLYRLDETATCLCSSHNSQKSDHFPVDYYSEPELQRLSEITGLSTETLHTKEVNLEVLNLLVDNVVWFYDVFLMDDDYQKIRDGIKTADKINDSLKRIISGKKDLAEIYKEKKGHYPTSVTIQ